VCFFFFFNDTATTEIYTLSLHDALPISQRRNDYCSFLRRVVTRIPLLHDVQIWNENNSPTFWPQDAGPDAYEALLARCWDVLHGAPTYVNVISSTAPRHDPAAFIAGVGAAYRASGRTRPLLDTFGHNPYPQDSAEAPSTTHAGSDYLGEGDYPALVQSLTAAFQGTAQPVPGMNGVGIWYLETGFQTVPPPDKLRFYRGKENDPQPVPAVAPARADGQPAVDQASQLRAAIRLAFCQPLVTGFFNFELLDEDKLGGWQSGVLWRDGTRKPSYDTFKSAIDEVRRKAVDCSKVAGAQAPPG